MKTSEPKIKTKKSIPASVIAKYIKTAELGDAEAQNILGMLYTSGDGVSEDPIEAAKWYRKAADLGNAEAQYALGVCYYNGSGVVKSLAQALKWWRKSAKQGDEFAQTMLESVNKN